MGFKPRPELNAIFDPRLQLKLGLPLVIDFAIKAYYKKINV